MNAPLPPMLALSAETFQANAMAWLGALVVLLPIATGAAVKLILSVAQLRQTLRDVQGDLIRRQDAQSRHLLSQQEQITGIAKAVPPPAAAAAAPAALAPGGTLLAMPLSSFDHPAPPDAN